MAEHLARIIGTEEDRVNCPFYWKIGACRHGDQCSRTHYKPTSGQTLILRHLYQNPPVALAIAEGQDVNDDAADQAQDHFEAFYDEVFDELVSFGEIEEMVVVDNIGDHMIGNTYVKYVNEDDAEKALKSLTGRFYGGRPIEAEFSPVTDFREARCRQFVDGQCTRGGYCNFMHLKHVPRSQKRKLMKKMLEAHPEYRKNSNRETAEEQPGATSHYRDLTRADKDRPEGEWAPDRSRGGDRERERDRDRPRDDFRSRDRDRNGGRDRDRDRDRDFGPYSRRRRDEPFKDPRRSDRPAGRSESEERRAMIAKWNEEAAEGK